MKGMKWEEVELGEVLTLQRGFDITKAQQKEGEYPVVSSSGIQSYHNEFKVQGEGVVIGRKGSLGTCYFIKQDFWAHDTTLYVKDFKGNNRRFVYYLLQTLNLASFDVGSSNPTLNRNHVHKIKVPLPPLPTQRRIAAILSAYDDLIENNLKRIKLLEEKAFLRYKEIVRGERFAMKAFSEVANYINGFPFKPDDLKEEGFPIIKIKELKGGVQDGTPRNRGENIPDKYFIENKDILFAWSASLGAYLWYSGKSILNQHIFNVKPFDAEMHNWIYFSLIDKMPDFLNLANGATMQHIKKSALGMVYLPVPGKPLIKEFQMDTDPILDLIVNLHAQNAKLCEARDILLPRLMSGEMGV